MNIFLVFFLLFSNQYKNFNNNLYSFLDSLLASFNEYLHNVSHSTFEVGDIEFCRSLDDLDGNHYLYFDFRGENGFILLRDDNKIVLFDTKIDLPILREKQNICFFDNDFLVEDCILDWRNERNNGSQNRDFVPGSIAIQYPGAIEYNDISTLLSTKYSLTSNWYLYDSGTLDGLSFGIDSNGYCQFDDSVYIRYDSQQNVYYSENNCGIISTANAICYYSEYNPLYSSIPSPTAYTSITPQIDEPIVLANAIANGYYPKNTSVSIHEIANDVRINAILAGYHCHLGMGDYETEYAYENTLIDYGYYGSFIPSNNSNGTNLSFSISTIKNEIDNNKPMQFRTDNDILYGSHGMMITGYRHYKADDYIYDNHHNFGLWVEYDLLFISIYDGWSQNERWYDLECLSNLGPDYARSNNRSIAFYHIEGVLEND